MSGRGLVKGRGWEGVGLPISGWGLTEGAGQETGRRGLMTGRVGCDWAVLNWRRGLSASRVGIKEVAGLGEGVGLNGSGRGLTMWQGWLRLGGA